MGAKPSVDLMAQLLDFVDEFVGFGVAHRVADVVDKDVPSLAAGVEIDDEIGGGRAEGNLECEEGVVVPATLLLHSKARCANRANGVEASGVVGHLESSRGREPVDRRVA